MAEHMPFVVTVSPIRELAIIPFERHPDVIYRAFELQYLDGLPYGKGYRIVAYRNDHTVDVYDDETLAFQENEAFSIVENGLHRHVRVPIANILFENREGCRIIAFSFTDIQHRMIRVSIRETTKRKTTPMNLLAPVGYGARAPAYLPAFFLYDFDFIRKGKTIVDCWIDDWKLIPDTLPVPVNLQARYFIRYSQRCAMLEFARTDLPLEWRPQLQGLTFRHETTEYLYDENHALRQIAADTGAGRVLIDFQPAFDCNRNGTGKFEILPAGEMGPIRGGYEVQRTADRVSVRLVPDGGWISRPKSMVQRLILQKRSAFCTWCKNYEYTAVIDLCQKQMTAEWKNKQKTEG